MSHHVRWGWIGVAAAGLFLLLAVTVRVAGVPAVERHVYDVFTSVIPTNPIPIARWITRLGSETILFPASAFLIVLLPRQFLRHWWIWVAVMLGASILDDLGKAVIGRPRPNGLRPGFPSGHTSAAAAFYIMACYFAQSVARGGPAKVLLYGAGAVLTVAVGLSRIARCVHWPLDVVGGAALGLAVVAGAVWWHERHPATGRLEASDEPPAWSGAIYRWRSVAVLSLVAVVFLRPPMAAAETLLDLMFDVAGGACIFVGLALRLWAACHADKQSAFPKTLPIRFITTGPYAHMRHPVPLSTLLIGVGLVLLAESGLGLTMIPALLIALFRITIPLEEAHLARRCGP